MRTWMLLAVAMFVGGCSQPASPPEQPEKKDVEEVVEQNPDGEKLQKEVSVPANVPAYTLTKDEMGMVEGFVVRSVSASANASSEEDLEAITRELWAETKTDILAITFYPNEPMAETSGAGQAFLGEDAARTFISAQYTDPSVADIDGQVQEAMENDGILLISIQDEVDSLNQSVCAEWDVTTMGTPPPEMNCPGF